MNDQIQNLKGSFRLGRSDDKTDFVDLRNFIQIEGEWFTRLSWFRINLYGNKFINMCNDFNFVLNFSYS